MKRIKSKSPGLFPDFYFVSMLLVLGLLARPSQAQDYKLPSIDLSHWKVTLPIGEKKPIEVSPPEIADYATNETVKPFMYNDSTDGSLVFHTYPGAVTGNTKYSRTELREQMVAGSNSTNWTFEQGGRMKGTLAVADISKKSDGKFDRTIVMQIHGRLSNEQKAAIGQKDNNAPPMLKIGWHKGYVRVKTKILKDINGAGTEILGKEAWGDDDGYNFSEYVGNKPFTLEVIATKGRLEVILNEKESKVYQSIHMRKWGIFENYFKAGNYLQSTDRKAFAKVKYYALEIDHNVAPPVKAKKSKKKKRPSVAIKNAGFDKQGANEYRDYWINKSLGGTLQITAKPVYDGEKAGKLPASGDRIAYQLLKVAQEKNYVLSFFYTMKDAPKGQLNVRILNEDISSPNQIEEATIAEASFRDQSANNLYTKAEVKFNTGKNNQIALYLSNENVECRFDSFRIVESKK